MNEHPKDFEAMGRDAWWYAGMAAVGISAIVAAAILGATVSWIGMIFLGIKWLLFGVVALAAATVIVSMLWAAAAPIGRWVAPFLPVRVWLTWGPPGGGPWLRSPAEAAQFVSEVSEMDAQDNPGEGLVQVQFSTNELRGLWLPGRQVEREDWGIKCVVIRRREIGQEWDGF